MAESGIYTPEAFAMKMDAFIAFCEGEGIDATDYQLLNFFGITPGVLENYRALNKLNNDSNIESVGYAAAMKKLALYREDATIRQAVAEPKLAGHCALKLRQPHWGGWSDKPDTACDIRIRLEIGDGSTELME
jgi:hypothetical protein